MAQTGAQAWEALDDNEREMAFDSAYDAFLLGFSAGWKAQENRPFFCAFCGVEIVGETDGETILRAQDHTRQCEVHPLGIEIQRLRAARLREALEHYGAHEAACFDDEDRCVCGLDDAKALT